MENAGEAYGDDLKRSMDEADDLLQSGLGEDETTSDDPRLTDSKAAANRRAQFYERARETRDKLNRALSDFGHRAGETHRRVRENAEERLKEGLDTTETKIKENPFAAVGIAAAAGLVLGLLINRNR